MEIPALILNDYLYKPYAEWVKTGKKTIETRMNRLFTYRGDIVICCGKSNSIGKNAGKALCIVDLFHGRNMVNSREEIEAACIGWDEDRKSLFMRNWRYFSEDFEFSKCAVKRNFQGIFSIEIPKGISIIPQPQIKSFDIHSKVKLLF